MLCFEAIKSAFHKSEYEVAMHVTHTKWEEKHPEHIKLSLLVLKYAVLAIQWCGIYDPCCSLLPGAALHKLASAQHILGVHKPRSTTSIGTALVAHTQINTPQDSTQRARTKAIYICEKHTGSNWCCLSAVSVRTLLKVDVSKTISLAFIP